MLGQIANYCSVISRDVIVKKLTSLKQIWLSIRFHLDFSRPVPISSTLMRSRYVKMSVPKIFTFIIDDNLLKREGGISHQGINIDENENMIVLTWLRLKSLSLPQLVKQRYGTELRVRT